jgi:polysaccharide export outer membrane protein
MKPTVTMLRRLLAIALLAAGALTPINQALAAEPLLGPGDTVRVTVFDDPSLTTEARLSLQGTLAFPLLGEVAIGDRTPSDAAKIISDRLKQGRFLQDPRVSVALVEVRSRRVMVMGHVVKPGQYALDGTNERLIDILALAGGRAETGADNVVVTRRTGEPKTFEVNIAEMYRKGDLTSDLRLEGGDVVYVPEAPVFYVYGAVQRAGVYRLEPATTVRAALSVGGGLTQRASQRRIEIHRPMPDGSVREFRARLQDPIQPNDVIYVKESLF